MTDLEPKDYIILLLGLVISIIANVLSALLFSTMFVHVIYVSTIAFLLVVIFVLNGKLNLLKYVGIKRIEKNISSETDTETLLGLVTDSFYMMGRGGSRFIEAKSFEIAISKVDRNKPIRFLLLKPQTPAPIDLSKERNVVPSHISDIISASLKTFKQYKDRGFNVEVRFYDNSKYIPIFRAVFIDDNQIFVSFYQRRETGKNSFQLVLFDPKNNNNLFVAFKLHFESMWSIAEKFEL